MNVSSFPLWANALVFTAAAGVVWFAGTRLSVYADALAKRTGAGEAALGVIMLGGITSLPEVAVSGTSAVSGDAALAVNNILGSVALQAALLAFADAAIGRDALTSIIVRPVVLLQATFGILILAIAAAGIIAGDVAIAGVGVWSSGLLTFYIAAVWLITRAQDAVPWTPTVLAEDRERAAGRRNHEARGPQHEAIERKADRSRAPLTPLGLKIAGVAALILVAGFLLSRTGESLAVQTGLGSSFVGAVLVAVATSLPELSTVLSAVRLHRYEMAVSDIVGTNLFNVAIIFVVDVLYRGPPVLNEVGSFAAFAAVLGIVITGLFLAGLIERRDRTILRMGIDSLAVVVAYIGGIALLFFLR